MSKTFLLMEWSHQVGCLKESVAYIDMGRRASPQRSFPTGAFQHCPCTFDVHPISPFGSTIELWRGEQWTWLTLCLCFCNRPIARCSRIPRRCLFSRCVLVFELGFFALSRSIMSFVVWSLVVDGRRTRKLEQSSCIIRLNLAESSCFGSHWPIMSACRVPIHSRVSLYCGFRMSFVHFSKDAVPAYARELNVCDLHALDVLLNRLVSLVRYRLDVLTSDAKCTSQSL